MYMKSIEHTKSLDPFLQELDVPTQPKFRYIPHLMAILKKNLRILYKNVYIVGCLPAATSCSDCDGDAWQGTRYGILLWK